MIRFDRAHQHLAVGIAILAGFVDAIGFVESSGFFVSFMTGNSTRLAVGLAQWTHAATVAGGIIAIFVAGVVTGSLVAARAGPRRSPAVLALVALLLVQMGQKIANARRGTGDGRWLAHLWLWAGLVAGAVAVARAVLCRSPTRWPRYSPRSLRPAHAR